jgi:hypothetical protein
MKAYMGNGCIVPRILDLGTTALTPERLPGTHWIGGCVGPRAVLDAVVRKIPSPRWESNPKTLIVQPVSQHYRVHKSPSLT